MPLVVDVHRHVIGLQQGDARHFHAVEQAENLDVTAAHGPDVGRAVGRVAHAESVTAGFAAAQDR